jgi:lysozyme family protein
VVPGLNLQTLTEPRATELLKTRYWDLYPYKDVLAPEVAAKVFDSHVFIGAKASQKLLRKTLSKMGYALEQEGFLTVKIVGILNKVLKEGKVTDLLNGYVTELVDSLQNVQPIKRGAAVRRAQKLPTVNNS